ncbi:MAG TPA: hypothetical protein VK789_33895 [Bryobacteraceae bacterium]|nr:hypothetical protein [Bryobacteraceae bacterium]
MESDMESILAKLTMAVLMIQGDADSSSGGEYEELARRYKYNEVNGGDHNSVIATGTPHIFAFFNTHTK